MNMTPVNTSPPLPKNRLDKERKLTGPFIHSVDFNKSIPVSSINNQTRAVIKQAGKKPHSLVISGMPSIPAPIVVPATSKLPLRTLENIEEVVVITASFYLEAKGNVK